MPPRLQDWNRASPGMRAPSRWARTCPPAAGMFARAPLRGAKPACGRHVCPPLGNMPPSGGRLPPISAPPARNYSRSVPSVKF
eukprot:3721013-Rhodomonas_salina.1